MVVKKNKRGTDNITRFCGWNTLEGLVKSSRREIVGSLIATLFETGCRVSEALLLNPKQFEVEEEWVMVYGAPVLKKGKVDPRSKLRNIPIPIDEPLVPYMIDWVDKCKTKKLFPRSRIWAYRQIRKVDPEWWPHRFRAERATQLVVEYGFNVPKLMRWFNWSDTKTPTNYVKLSVEDLKVSMKRR